MSNNVWGGYTSNFLITKAIQLAVAVVGIWAVLRIVDTEQNPNSDASTTLLYIAAFVTAAVAAMALVSFFMGWGAEQVEEVAEKPKKERQRRSSSKKDDLTVIEGVGPKIASLLSDAGYSTFSDVASADADELKQVLLDAGDRFRMHETATWSEQAELAADGDWDELEAMQDELDGGKR